VRDTREIYLRPSVAEIQKQAARCLDCGVPGCRSACPLANRIPDWMRAAARGEFAVAAEIAHSTSALPEVCGRLCPQHRLCEGACTRAKEDGAVTIGAIEQYVTELALERGWKPAAPKARNGRRIAVIGAGPAGLACADFLNRDGCAVTVFDRHSDIGGLLTQGVPPFKLDRTALAARRELLEASGIEFKLGSDVDSTRMSQIVDGHGAVFLATGAQTPRASSLPGRTLPEVYSAIDYLNENPPLPGKRVLILGGGDTAMDCARTARRAGAEVTISTRAAEENLRASPRETKGAQEEGVTLQFQHLPLAILGHGKVEAVQFQTPGGVCEQACDAVILAFGFIAQPPAWLAGFGIETDAEGRIHIDAQGRTSHPKIYAGGDNAHGPDLVVTAMADGRQAARGIIESFRLTRRAKAALRGLTTPVQAAPAAVTVRQ